MSISSNIEIQSDFELNTSTAGLRRVGFLVFFILFLGFGIWSYFAKLEGAVIASGTVTVSGQAKTVQHLDGGIVNDIMVENGKVVRKGDSLIRLDQTELRANYDIIQNQLRELINRRDRLRAEKDGVWQIVWDNNLFDELSLEQDLDIQKSQATIFKARRQSRNGQTSQLQERLAQLDDQINGLHALISSRDKQIKTLQKELSGLRGLLANGYTSENRVLSVQRQLEELVGQTAQNETEISRIRNTISETNLQITQIDKEFSQQVFEEIREVEQQLNDLKQQFIAISGQLERVEILAPVSGIVHELSVFTKGGVISPGQPIMQLVPLESEMEFEVNVEPQFIDEIKIGQEVSLFFSAFNARTTPNIDGTVEFVSLQTRVQEDIGVAFYPVKISIPAEQISRLNGQVLISGMPFEAFFTTESRSPLNYLIKPLTDNLKRAGREQ